MLEARVRGNNVFILSLHNYSNVKWFHVGRHATLLATSEEEGCVTYCIDQIPTKQLLRDRIGGPFSFTNYAIRSSFACIDLHEHYNIAKCSVVRMANACVFSYWSGLIRLCVQANRRQEALQLVVSLSDLKLIRDTQPWGMFNCSHSDQNIESVSWLAYVYFNARYENFVLHQGVNTVCLKMCWYCSRNWDVEYSWVFQSSFIGIRLNVVVTSWSNIFNFKGILAVEILFLISFRLM